MIDNPFQFEKDPKKFTNSLEYDRNAIEEEDDQKQQTRLTQLYIGKSASRYGLLRKLEEQTEKLAIERDVVFTQDMKSKSFNAKPDPIQCHLKQFNPRMLEKNYQDSLQKAYKIRNILGEKKETLQDFVEKKREICLTNLNVLTKKEETNRLEDFIKNEQESLRARKLYFKNDCELVKRFMSEVKSQADQAAILADKEVRRKEEVKVEVARILAQIDRLKLQKSKLQDEYDKLDKYRQFLEKIKQHYKTKFSELEKEIVLPQTTTNSKRTLFMTGVNVLESETRSKEQLEQLQFEYKQNKMADTVIEILDAIEEGNLRNMQNQRDAEEEFEQKKREASHLREILAIHQKENEQRFKVLEKQYVMHQQYQQELKKQDKVDQNKLEFAEGENLDMDKIGKRIIEIYTDVSKKEQDPLIKKQGIDSKILKITLNQLEKIVLELSEYKLQFLMKSKQDFIDAEKKINLKKKEQRQTNQKDEEKKKQIMERRRKKEEQMANFYRGRKDVRRNYPAEKVVVEQVVEDNDENDDEKYLQESYELVYVPTSKNMMDLINLNKPSTQDLHIPNPIPSTSQSKMPTRNISETNLNNIQSRNNTLTIRQNSQMSQRKQTKDNGYHKIAYQQQIKKNQISLKRKRSVSSISSTSSMQQSFLKMEEKMKKFKLNNPEIIDQKYMISGYLELSKDYKNLVFTIRKYGQDLDALLKFGLNEMKEDNICKVDQFFEKHSNLLSTKVDDYFKIKECFYRFLRMKIQEPYYYRVKKKIHLIEKHNQTFETFRIYLEAFKFINKDGFDYFKDDLQLIKGFKKPPTLESIGILFNEKIEELREQIQKTKELTEGRLLSQIFDHKIDQIYKWKQLIIQLAYFQYNFNIHYLLNTNTKTKKYIKSKKLYEQLFQILEQADQFLIENYTINQVYSDEIAQFKCDFNEIKQQILEWNIKLRENEFYKQILSIVKQNLYLKSINQRLETILSIRQSDEYDKRMDAKATDMIIKAKMQLQNIGPIIQEIKQCKQIKDDEYIQKLFNKFVLMKDYFQNLKNEFEI